MLTLTRDAAEAIREIVDQSPLEGDEGGLRITASPVSETQAALELTLAEEPDPADEVVEQSGARVYLEPVAAAALTDKVLDADVEDEGVRFTIVDQATGPLQSEDGNAPAG